MVFLKNITSCAKHCLKLTGVHDLQMQVKPFTNHKMKLFLHWKILVQTTVRQRMCGMKQEISQKN